MLFSIILIKTTNFERKDGDYLYEKIESISFHLLGLLIVRLVGKLVLSSTIDVGELGGMFWILAFGMIVPWRIGMFVKYNKLTQVKGVRNNCRHLFLLRTINNELC